MDLLLQSVYFSIFMQLLTGLVQLDGLFIKLPKEHQILQDVLKLETLVQFIEASFYVWLVFNYKNIARMASKRYYDWMVTTPAMLLATIIYMKYSEHKERKVGAELPEMKFSSFITENQLNIVKIFVSNALMLLCGFLGEIGKVAMTTSVAIGSIFFLYTFYLIWEEYAKHSGEGVKLFKFLFIVWGLYAVAAVMRPKKKNIGYNLLDIVSKNFYGLYIYYVIKTLSLKTL
tara:strand:- start:817 stop:1509 length:693 start_codon:yes stop_codon:yes gene_type:complete